MTELGLDGIEAGGARCGLQVVRCWVTALDPLRYRCAVAFEHLGTEGSG